MHWWRELISALGRRVAGCCLVLGHSTNRRQGHMAPLRSLRRTISSHSNVNSRLLTPLAKWWPPEPEAYHVVQSKIIQSQLCHLTFSAKDNMTILFDSAGIISTLLQDKACDWMSREIQTYFTSFPPPLLIEADIMFILRHMLFHQHGVPNDLLDV